MREDKEKKTGKDEIDGWNMERERGGERDGYRNKATRCTKIIFPV